MSTKPINPSIETDTDTDVAPEARVEASSVTDSSSTAAVESSSSTTSGSQVVEGREEIVTITRKRTITDATTGNVITEYVLLVPTTDVSHCSI